MKWLFKLKKDKVFNLGDFLNQTEVFQICSDLVDDVYFPNDKKPILVICKNGKIIIKKGYAWDGNSPKINVLDVFWLGTPDGIIHEGKPITYYASMIHDALGQFKYYPQMPSYFRSKKRPDWWFSEGRLGRDYIYFKLLEKNNFIWRYIYYVAVALAGPLYDSYLSFAKKVEFEACKTKNE